MNTATITTKRILSIALTLSLLVAFSITALQPRAHAQDDGDDPGIVNSGVDPSDQSLDPNTDDGLPDDLDVSPDDVANTPDDIATPLAFVNTNNIVTADDKKKAGGTAKFTTKTQCVAAMNGKTLSRAKKSAKNYAATRNAALKNYSITVANNNKKMLKAYKTEQKKYYIDKSVRYKRSTHNKQIRAELKSTRTDIITKYNTAKASNDKAVVAENACSIIYDVRVFTYMPAKISYQQAIDKLYMRNNLLTAQFNSLQKNGSSIDSIKSMPNPQTTHTAIDKIQQKLDAINAGVINQVQATDSKKKAATIFKERLSADIKAAAKLNTTDTKAGNKGKGAIKSSKASAQGSASFNQSSSASNALSNGSSNANKVKKQLTAAQKKQVCKDSNAATLLVNRKLSDTLTSACNTGISAGFKKTSSKDKFCASKFDSKKKPKQVAACEYGYEKGEALRTQ